MMRNVLVRAVERELRTRAAILLENLAIQEHERDGRLGFVVRLSRDDTGGAPRYSFQPVEQAELFRSLGVSADEACEVRCALAMWRLLLIDPPSRAVSPDRRILCLFHPDAMHQGARGPLGDLRCLLPCPPHALVKVATVANPVAVDVDPLMDNQARRYLAERRRLGFSD